MLEVLYIKYILAFLIPLGTQKVRKGTHFIVSLVQKYAS